MCTAICMNAGDFYFARSMDIEYNLVGSVTVTPQNYRFEFTNGEILKNHYAIIGMAVVKNGYPLYAEAANQAGLCMAALSFTDSAPYSKPTHSKTNIAPFELIPYLLCKCKDIREAKNTLIHASLVDLPFDEQTPNTPLHWIIADKNGAVVVEQTEQGLAVYDDPFGVLTNNPPFPFHKENIRAFRNISQEYNCSGVFSDLCPLGGGSCGNGLPGDYSSPSRFVKAAFLRRACKPQEDIRDNSSHMLALLGAVAPPKGAVLDKNEKPHYAVYSCCINADKGIYYLHKYESNDTDVFSLSQCDLLDSRLKTLT